MKTVQTEAKKIETKNKQEEISKNVPEEFWTPESVCRTENKNTVVDAPPSKIVIDVDNDIEMQDTEKTPVLKKEQDCPADKPLEKMESKDVEMKNVNVSGATVSASSVVQNPASLENPLMSNLSKYTEAQRAQLVQSLI